VVLLSVSSTVLGGSYLPWLLKKDARCLRALIGQNVKCLDVTPSFFPHLPKRFGAN